MGEQRLINCGACGTPLTHINEPCPNCLPKMAERPPTQQVYDSGIPQMNAELQRLRAALREAEEKLAAERTRGARLEGALRWYADAGNYEQVPLGPDTSYGCDFSPTEVDEGARARSALSSGPSALEAVKTVTDGIFWLIEQMEILRKSDNPHSEFQNFWGTDAMKRIEEAATTLRTAFGLTGDGGER